MLVNRTYLVAVVITQVLYTVGHSSVKQKLYIRKN